MKNPILPFRFFVTAAVVLKLDPASSLTSKVQFFFPIRRLTKTRSWEWNRSFNERTVDFQPAGFFPGGGPCDLFLLGVGKKLWAWVVCLREILG